jgi:uncharacterized cofD-like protein
MREDQGRQDRQEKKVVVIGGGSGTDAMLACLRDYACRLTVLVSTFDSDAQLRGHEQNHERKHDGGTDSPTSGPANGEGEGGPEADGRRPGLLVDGVPGSLLALGADPATKEIMERLFAYPLSQPVGGAYTFGNLFLSTLAEITGGAELAMRAATRVLNVQGEVLPLTLRPCPLVARLNDDTEVQVSSPTELQAAAAKSGLRAVRLALPTPALDAALHAIRQADIVVLGPADLYFNVLAPLQLDGMGEALADSRAAKIFVCNTLTQPHTTDGWPASRFIRAVLESAGRQNLLDYVIVNSGPLAVDALAMSAARGCFPVEVDLDECFSLGVNVIVRPVVQPGTVRHDPEKLVRTILFLGGWRSAKRVGKRHPSVAGAPPEEVRH